MKTINGENAILGRIAAYAAKESLKGEEVNIVNCENVIITGNKSFNEKRFEERRSRVGSSQKGPKVPRSPDRIVKRTIRGMIPNHRFGRGRVAFKKIKCYNGIPSELKDEKLIEIAKEQKKKFGKLKEIVK